MLKKICATGILLIASSNLSFADSKKQGNRHISYKEEISTIVTTSIAMQSNLFSPSSYLGASLGSRINYASLPSTYVGLEGNIFGGYGGLVKENLYLSGELDIGNNAILSNYHDAQGSERSTWSASVSIIPGFLLANNSLFYLRAGMRTTHFSTPNNNPTTPIIGAGLQVALSREWNIRGEYIYGFYRHLSSIGVPRSQQANLGVLYKFL